MSAPIRQMLLLPKHSPESLLCFRIPPLQQWAEQWFSAKVQYNNPRIAKGNVPSHSALLPYRAQLHIHTGDPSPSQRPSLPLKLEVVKSMLLPSPLLSTPTGSYLIGKNSVQTPREAYSLPEVTSVSLAAAQ